MKKIIILLLIILAIIFLTGIRISASQNSKTFSDWPVLKGKYLGQKPPGMTPEIFAPSIISTKDHIEFSCTFNPEMTEFYFARVGGSLGHNYSIMVSKWVNGKLSDPVPVAFNTPYLENEPHITPDGRYMYFNSSRPVKGNKSIYNIWRVKKVDHRWSRPEVFRNGMFLSSAINGNIYYTDISDTNDPGIIVCAIYENNKYSQSSIVDGGVNTKYSDAHPFIAPDESYIIFDSYRPGGYTKTDIYICYKLPDNSWSDAINLGKEINLKGDTGFASISPDQKYLFFTLNEDIYWVDAKIIEELKPNYLK